MATQALVYFHDLSSGKALTYFLFFVVHLRSGLTNKTEIFGRLLPATRLYVDRVV